MLRWPERAKAAIKKLFEPLQDIDVYVEDTNDEAFYRTLLNKICKDEVTIARVFSLGGREAVVDAAKKHDHKKRRALFIIDGDLDWVLGVPPPNVIGLHQHGAYCIENLLVCEKALCEILSQEIVVTEDVAAELLKFSWWVNSIQQPLVELFSAFATARKFAPEEKTVAQGVGVLCTNQGTKVGTHLDVVKVSAALDKALAAAEGKVGKQKARAMYRRTLSRSNKLAFPLHCVSGKDFILPLLDFWLQKHGCRIKRKSLRMRLAMAGDIKRFTELNNAIASAAIGHV